MSKAPSRSLPGLVIVSFLLIAAIPTFAARILSGQAQLLLTTTPNGSQGTSEFSCSDTVNGLVVLPERVVGFHSVEAYWSRNGEVVEHSQVPLQLPPPGSRTAHIWLRFDDKQGGLLEGLLGDGTDTAGMVSGDWKVSVHWNGKPLVESEFKVKC
jgi:hypothetical protein